MLLNIGINSTLKKANAKIIAKIVAKPSDISLKIGGISKN